MRSTRLARGLTCLVVAVLPWTAGCRPATPAGERADAYARPVQAVEALAATLREDDLAGFARGALPPALHARVEAAWREGRSRWPLDELPLAGQLPRLLSTLSADGAEAALGAAFDRQFAGADAEIRGAAATLGVFGMQYVRHDGDYDDTERDHLAQLVAALGRWAETAPLADGARGHDAIARLSRAARATGLADEAAFARLGMDPALRAFSGFLGESRAVLAGYGLDLEATLAGLEVRLDSQTGDRARVRVRYPVAGTPVDAFIDLERRDGRWYVGHLLRHAEASIAPAAPAG